MNNLFDLTGRAALVTGGSRGIGEMFATGFVAAGVKTYISSRKADVCDATAARLSASGECISVPADLSSLDGAFDAYVMVRFAQHPGPTMRRSPVAAFGLFISRDD